MLLERENQDAIRTFDGEDVNIDQDFPNPPLLKETIFSSPKQARDMVKINILLR